MEVPSQSEAARFRKVNTPKAASAVTTAQKNFDSFVNLVEKAYAITLPSERFDDIKKMKEFCSGLLLPNGSAHPWARPISQLKLRDRLSIRGSLFLFRKTLPGSIPDLKEYALQMGQTSVDPPAGFFDHCTKQLRAMFKLGWDRKWAGKVEGATVTCSSTMEASRKRGGGRSILGNGWLDREEFCRDLLDKTCNRQPNVSVARMAIAPCDGKFRSVSINSIDMTFIQPYHELLYDTISEFDWCLRGEAIPRRFLDFVKKDGEIFVSGDYESATDNLNLEVARHILTFIGRQCSRVPLFVREAALRTLGGELEVDGLTYPVRRGQLMGNAMSFPLLCIQNFLAFTFFIKRDVPVKINGDDIVFRATRQEADCWASGVKSCGLTLSLGKTMFSENEFSLNSTFFYAGTRKVRMAPVIRSTCFFKKIESLGSLQGRFDTLRYFPHRIRTFLHSQLLRRFSGQIWWSQRSVTRGLEIGVSTKALKLAGLFDRELFFLSLPVEKPLPPAKFGVFESSVPDGWERSRNTAPIDRAEQQQFFKEMVALAWKPQKSTRQVVNVQCGTSPFAKGRPDQLRMRLAGFSSVFKFRRYLRSTYNPVSRKREPIVLKKQREFGVTRWVKKKVVPVEEQLEESETVKGTDALFETSEDYYFGFPTKGWNIVRSLRDDSIVHKSIINPAYHF